MGSLKIYKPTEFSCWLPWQKFQGNGTVDIAKHMQSWITSCMDLSNFSNGFEYITLDRNIFIWSGIN